MAGDAVTIGLGALAIFIGGCTKIFTADTSTALVVAGIGSVTAGITMEAVGGKDYANTVKACKSLEAFNHYIRYAIIHLVVRYRLVLGFNCVQCTAIQMGFRLFLVLQYTFVPSSLVGTLVVVFFL